MDRTPETNEAVLYKETKEALQKASATPYNNAAAIYHAAGIEPDMRLGGSCLDKLVVLQNALPEEVKQHIRFITSQVGKTTHFAAIATFGKGEYYLDPFLWQSEPMNLSDNNDIQSPTMSGNWVIRRKHLGISPLTMSFVEVAREGKPEKAVVVHQFLEEIDQLPSMIDLNVRPDLPSYHMQILSLDGRYLYKIWFLKEAGEMGEISVLDGATGVRTRIPPEDEVLRVVTISDIASSLEVTPQEIKDYFGKAYELEKQLAASGIKRSAIGDHEGLG